MDEFTSVLRKGVTSKVNIALLKLCYVNFSVDTDVQQLLRYYLNAMEKMSDSFPNLNFVHLTAPLVVNQATWKAKIKLLTGKGTLWEHQANIVRNQYNDLLVQEYRGRKPVFDIAKYESTYENGKRHMFQDQKKTYSSMILEYIHDSGHLNNKERKWVANNLLTFLNGLEFD
ncbi:hypothetical protein [uncultured Desulfuromusa sp.]|uniref:hypothetical protein n=1 Tax=uncultured Desulfuromusa sp. TaxID=219183 RepID=UPI002AA8B6E8|nr:hypothetical protein [uncultured Desulfuromusa sp.]